MSGGVRWGTFFPRLLSPGKLSRHRPSMSTLNPFENRFPFYRRTKGNGPRSLNNEGPLS